MSRKITDEVMTVWIKFRRYMIFKSYLETKKNHT